MLSFWFSFLFGKSGKDRDVFGKDGLGFLFGFIYGVLFCFVCFEGNVSGDDWESGTIGLWLERGRPQKRRD